MAEEALQAEAQKGKFPVTTGCVDVGDQACQVVGDESWMCDSGAFIFLGKRGRLLYRDCNLSLRDASENTLPVEGPTPERVG